MSRKVLVLNADYRALSVVTLYKAFLLVFLGKAETVKKLKDAAIRTVDRSFDAPSIIRLNRYVNMPYKGVMLSRQNVFKRDGYCCVYCGDRKDLTLDHVIPRSKGGDSTWTNLVAACKSCNSRKGNFSPEEVEMELPYKPYKPSFVMFLRDFGRVDDESWFEYLNVKSG